MPPDTQPDLAERPGARHIACSGVLWRSTGSWPQPCHNWLLHNRKGGSQCTSWACCWCMVSIRGMHSAALALFWTAAVFITVLRLWAAVHSMQHSAYTPPATAAMWPPPQSPPQHYCVHHFRLLLTSRHLLLLLPSRAAAASAGSGGGAKPAVAGTLQPEPGVGQRCDAAACAGEGARKERRRGRLARSLLPACWR